MFNVLLYMCGACVQVGDDSDELHMATCGRSVKQAQVLHAAGSAPHAAAMAGSAPIQTPYTQLGQEAGQSAVNHAAPAWI